MQFGIYNEDLSIIPESEIAILRFIAYAALSYEPSTIKSYLSAVRSLHVFNGFENPLENKPRIQLVLRGIKRLSGNPRRMRCPITPESLLIICSRLNLSLYDHCLLWAAFCIAFFGFLRAGEFTVTPTRLISGCLQLSDVSADALPFPSFLRLFIKVSKTDPFIQSCTVIVGRNSSLLCPLEAFRRYLHLGGSRPGPLFIFQNRVSLSRSRLNSLLTMLLNLCGINGDYTGHSFRIGAATTAARAGVPDHLIQTLGRWSSDAYKLYIMSPESHIAAISSTLSFCFKPVTTGRLYSSSIVFLRLSHCDNLIVSSNYYA